LSPYAASKHAIVGLTKSASLEVAEHNVRMNSIHPAPVGGEMMDNLKEGAGGGEEAKEAFLSQIPFGRYAESEDLANLALFLASDDSDFITVSQYRADGGMGAQQ